MHLHRRLRRVFTAFGVAVVMTAGLLVAGVTPASAAVTYKGWFTFVKNGADPSNSRLYWDVYRADLDPPRRVIAKSWRAGSGTSTNPCTRDAGWLPNGWYSVKQWDNYPGSVIKGNAFQLNETTCSGGTPRTALFIHTETGSNMVQCADAPGDQPCRWEYPTYNDYGSDGCIKLSPGDIVDARNSWRQFYPNGVWLNNMLLVTG